MKRSEIFESFVKIAQEKGLIAEADHAEHTEKDFHETNPRHDSLSIEQIGKLYGNKPQMPKGMEYKNNIMEVAHPESSMLVISPSHDKLNGLIENNIEGQNIRLRIVRKEPDGHLTQRKYAQQNLVLSLVRVANELDNRDQDELRKLADVCLLQASQKKIEKRAVWGLVIAAAGALFAALYAKEHLRFHSDGFEADYDKAIAEIDDLLNSNSNWGVGYAYTPEFIQTVNQLKTVLSELHSEVQKILPILDKVEKPRTKQELLQMAQQSDSMEASRALDEFRQEVEKIQPFIQKVVLDFGNESYKQRAIKEKGALTSLIDVTEVLHGGKGLVADDFDDVKHALQTLMVDINNIVKGLRDATNIKQKFIQEAEAAQSETAKMFAAEPETPEAQPTKPAVEESGIGSLEEEGEGLMGGLGGLIPR
jgi:hypothetical protein